MVSSGQLTVSHDIITSNSFFNSFFLPPKCNLIIVFINIKERDSILRVNADQVFIFVYLIRLPLASIYAIFQSKRASLQEKKYKKLNKNSISYLDKVNKAVCDRK